MTRRGPAARLLPRPPLYSVEPPSAASRTKDDSEIPSSAQEIGDRVVRRYREARSIHIEGRSSRAGHTLDYHHDGSQESFRTICFHGSALYGAFSLHNGRVQEFVPDDPAQPVLEYDAEMDGQIPHLAHPRPLDCVYGQQFALWIGPNSHPMASLQKRLPEARLRGREVVGDRPCDVIEHVRLARAQESDRRVAITQVYYVDAEDFVFRRWDTTADAALQQRIYRVMELCRQAPDIDWDIRAVARLLEQSGTQPRDYHG
jgi:hypothetical protein